MDKKYILLLFSGIIAISLMGVFTVSAIQSDSLTKQLQLAKQYFEEQDYEKSIEAYTNVLKLDPLNVDARLGLTEAYIAISNYELAETTLLEGIELLPSQEIFHSQLSQIYIDQLDVVSALQVLHNGVEATNSTSLIDLYEKLQSTIKIKSRLLVQPGYSRTLSLVWEVGNQSTPLKADWTVIDDTIGTLNKESNTSEVEFTALNLGETAVTATIGNYSFERHLEVHEQVLEELEFTPNNIDTLAVGQSLSLQVSGYDLDGNPMDFIPEWSLENEIGELSSTDSLQTTLTALEEGETTLTIRYKDFRRSLDLSIEGENKIVTYNTTGQGDVVVSPLQDSYPIGTEITIEAQPHPGWKFTGWGDEYSNEPNTFTVTINENIKLHALFEQEDSYSLSLATTGEGQIIRSSLNNTFTSMDTVTLTARPSEGWLFKGWDGSETSTNDRISVTMDSNKSIRAVFIQDEDEQEVNPQQPVQEVNQRTTYSLSLNSTEGGQITKDQSGNQFNSGTRVTLTAVPNSGWKFDRWEGNARGTSRTATVTMDSNKTVKAIFLKVETAPKPEPESKPETKQFTLTSSTSGNGSINSDRAGSTFAEGTTVSLTATPGEGWEFVRWEGDVSGQSPSIQVTLNTNRSVRAVFNKKTEDTTEDIN
ncbi:InlB B-repeat-containing protein [Halalkalibacter alkaliphilus]|uniref:InlB B-repeat-containing protein n=1 Tax=Halalkalibacter alkaliphilus TaxID=2917993 RepID=A0A9X2I844_9BACI|nr:tetratricopeptide repeat protein [Halalkalibacter alkaliphilus]MCL7748045.1 InlB B-repeat-containing protein [Halalkalibacter alkaliphilus]